MKRKILFVVSSLNIGGAENHTVSLANGLYKTYRQDISIAVIDNRKDLITRVEKGIKVFFLNKRRYIDFTSIKKLRKIISKGYDLIINVDTYANMYTVLANKFRKENMYTVIHSTLPRNNKEALKRIYLSRLLGFNKKIVFVSQLQMQYWINRFKINRNKCTYIYNGVKIKNFSEYFSKEEIKEISELNLNENDIVIGTCSNFRCEKRITDLVKACGVLKEKGYKIKLILIGDGVERRKIEEEIDKQDLKRDTFITGYTDDVRPYLYHVDIFVLSSVAVETLSIAAIEAMAMKKALVLSDIGGAKELVIDDHNGKLYNKGDYMLLTEGIESIISNEKYKLMGINSLLHCKDKFCYDNMLKQWYKCLGA